MHNMRSSTLITGFVVLTGCVVNVSGPGGPGGDDNQPPTPTLNVAVDRPTVATELGKTEMVTFTLTGMGGFGGDVQLNASLVDSANMPITAVTMTGPTTESVPANGSTTAVYMVTIPMDATGVDITGTLKVDLTSSLGPQSASSAITLAAVYTVTYIDGTGVDPLNHAMKAGTITLKRGAILRMLNSDTTVPGHIIHADGNFAALHEDPRNNPPETVQPYGAHYDLNTNLVPAGTGTVGCHTHGTASYFTFTTL